MKKRRGRVRTIVSRWAPWVAVVLGAAAFIGVIGAVQLGSHQVETSSGYCASCHADYAGDEHLVGHDDTACQDCHPAPDEDRLRFVWAIVDPDVALPEHGELDPSSCESCHAANETDWKVLMRTEGHATHAKERPEDESGIACVRCHSGSLHARPQQDEGCLSCHEDVPLESEPRSEADCVTCHVFGSAPTEVAGGETAEQQEPTWASRVGVDAVHGAADCRLCHNPHQPELHTAPDCTECHRGNIAASAARGPEQHGACTGCHAVHAPREDLPTLCLNCHPRPGVLEATVPARRISDAFPDGGLAESMDAGVPPVADGGLPLSATTVFASTGTAPVSKSELEARTHQGRCPSCHRPHAFRATPDVCKGCHEHQDKVQSLGRLPEGTHEQCVGCHDPHQPPPDRDACLQCHNKPLGRGVPSRHRDCMSCHEPHSPRPSFRSACSAQCHEGPIRSLRRGPARHRNCSSCHTPHGDPDARSPNACPDCHEDKARLQRRAGRHQQCISCHVPHSFEREAATSHCGACHSQPTAAGAAHRGECASCHAIHGGRSQADDCSNCHDIQLGEPRHRCEGCHRPHLPAATALEQCGTCHRQPVAVARTWPQDSPHAGRCMECHTRHRVQDKKQCSTCHEERANRTHMGVHDRCTGCHDPHGEAPANPQGWWNRCPTCHTDEGRRAASAGREQHRHCQNCHDRPGREAPSCPTCHDDMAQHGLHAIPEHSDCTNCHTTHGTTAPRPPQCRACHTDRANHFPQAQKCQACHIFVLQ